jgi:hypothetical protein
VTQKSGLFEFSLAISKGITVQTPGVEVIVKDAQDKLVEIKKKQKDPTEMVQNIPPELKIDNLIGGFEIHGHGMLTFHFRVPYTDLKGNVYYSNEEIVKIDDLSELDGDLSYNYNFIQNTAQA